VRFADEFPVIPARLLLAVSLQVGRIQAELLDDVVDDHGRGVGRVGQEGAEKTHRPEL
jgi:hypothetical protein